jgi:hypothetical protein
LLLAIVKLGLKIHYTKKDEKNTWQESQNPL